MPLYHTRMERMMGIEPTSQAWEVHILPLNHTRKEQTEIGAGRENRTLVNSLEDCRTTIVLHPHYTKNTLNWSR